MHRAVLRDAQPADYAAITALLTGAGLPVDDLSPDDVRWFVVVQTKAGKAAGRTIVGAGAVQPIGENGLLRSVVVAPALRSGGLGARLVRALETRAGAAGLVALYLLTGDAQAFFRTLGYQTIDRREAPETVRASAQFASICPSSATCMARTLAGAARYPESIPAGVVATQRDLEKEKRS
jgi:amino-acid N-acetyltransferase